MSCQRVLSMLSAYVDGEVHGPDASLIERHLEQCASCAQELRALQRTTEVLRAAPEVEPPAFLMQQIEAATVKRVGLLTSLRRAFDYVPRYARWAPATCGAAAAVVAAILFALPGGVKGPGAMEGPVVRLHEAAPAGPAMPLPGVEKPAEMSSEPTVVVTERPRRKLPVKWAVRQEEPAPATTAAPTSAEESIESKEAETVAVVDEGGEADEDTLAADSRFGEFGVAKAETDVAAPVAAEPASATTVAEAEITEGEHAVAAPEEPGAIEELRAKLKGRDTQRLHSPYVERVEGKKYSVELVSFRF